MNRVIADRGDSWKYPENSKMAIHSALDPDYYSSYSNYEGAFVDVRMTRDNQLVLCRSSNLMFISSGAGRICCYSLDELKQYQCQFHKLKFYQYYGNLRFSKEDEATKYLIHKLKKMMFQFDQFMSLEEALQCLHGQKEIILNLCEDEFMNPRYMHEVIRIVNMYSGKDIKICVPNDRILYEMKSLNPLLQVGVRVNGDTSRKLNFEHNFEICSIHDLVRDCFLLERCINWMKEGKPLYVDSLVIMKDMLSYIKMFQESGMYPHAITPNSEIYRSLMQRAYQNGFVAYREVEKKEFVLRSTR